MANLLKSFGIQRAGKTVLQWIDPTNDEERSFGFDATIREGHSSTARPTRFPVEDGSEISD